MYAKLFSSLYQGTLRGKSNEILVFTNLLAHCDKEGYVDKHFRAIAEETGITVDEVKSAIAVLEEPDPESRSPEHEGRRIVRIDDHRAWGWLVVNYPKYRSIRDEEARRDTWRKSQAKRREEKKNEKRQRESTLVNTSPNGSTHTEAEGDTHTDAVSPTSKQPPSPPKGEFIDLAKALWESCPKLGRERSSKVKLLDAIQKLPKKHVPDIQTATSAIRAWCASESWSKDGGQFVCGIHIWVKNRQWETLPEPVTPRRAGNPNELKSTLKMPIINLDD